VKKDSTRQLQKSQIWSELSDANLVVVTIITTVSFSATFQVPGGYNSEGKAILRMEQYFRLYMISDALSFGLAAASMFVTFFTELFEENSGFNSLSVGDECSDGRTFRVCRAGSFCGLCFLYLACGFRRGSLMS